MQIKTYFTELLVAISVCIVLLGLLGFMIFTDQQLKKTSTVRQAAPVELAEKTEDQEKILLAEEQLVALFTENYFNYSSDNYKERLPNLEEILAESFYKDLKSTFDDMFIEKGFKSSLNSYALYQSPNDLDSAFITVSVTYEVNGSEQQEDQSAVIYFASVGDKKVISDLKFVKRSEF